MKSIKLWFEWVRQNKFFPNNKNLHFFSYSIWCCSSFPLISNAYDKQNAWNQFADSLSDRLQVQIAVAPPHSDNYSSHSQHRQPHDHTVVPSIRRYLPESAHWHRLHMNPVDKNESKMEFLWLLKFYTVKFIQKKWYRFVRTP